MGDEEDSNPRKRCRDEITKADEEEQTATKKPCVTTSEGLTDDAAERHEASNLDKLGEEQHTRKEEESISEEDEAEMRKDQEKDTLSLQARGEEGETESVKKDTLVRETINDRNINTGVKCATLSKVKTSGDKEVQDNLFMNEDSTCSSSTEENTNEKSEKLKETKVDDAPVNVGEQLNNSSEQHLDEETKAEKQKQTECQKPAETNSEDLTDEVKEEQGEEIGLEEQKGEEVENKNVIKKDTDDEENTQIGHSEEDDGQMRKDQEKDALSLQARGEEGDKESVNKDTSVRETIIDRNTNSDEDCEKQKLLNSEDEEVQENRKSMGSTFDGKSVNQSYTMKSSGDHDDSRFICPAEENETQCILQVREEQGETESVKKDTSVRETINDRNINTGVKCATLSKVKTSGDKEVQDNLFMNEDSTRSSSTEENTNEKSEELKETKVNDAPVNVGEQKCSSKKTNTVMQKQTAIQPQRVHYGLYNQGATCYLNSVLQVLFMTPEVHDRFNSELHTEMTNIFAGLKKGTCGTEKITRILQIKNVYEQGDAAEYLELILNKIRQQDTAVFQGRLMYTTKCSEGHIINKETNPFWTLPLCLKDNHDTTYSVERSFERFFQTKTFNGHNKVHCNKCNNKTEATKECEMEKYPPILTLLLKRFDFDYRRMSHYKSDCSVDVPLELKRKNQTYKLYGMVNHMGSLTGGHYTATILSNEDETWYECSDSYVGKVKQLFAGNNTYTSRTVYLLMYRATESQMPCGTKSGYLAHNAMQEQDDSILDEPRPDEVEYKKNDDDDEDEEQTEMQEQTECHLLIATNQNGDEEEDKGDSPGADESIEVCLGATPVEQSRSYEDTSSSSLSSVNSSLSSVSS
uniref:Ubiquitin carboxyl-terminal hydrolase n=1 Tax=Dicentrarchus labrax TaxID=13489 RepID=A0A8P4GHK4_DICLA